MQRKEPSGAHTVRLSGTSACGQQWPPSVARCKAQPLAQAERQRQPTRPGQWCRSILHSPVLACYRCRPLSSHVRPHQNQSVRQVRQSSALDANSRRHRVRQGFAGAAMGGISAPPRRPQPQHLSACFGAPRIQVMNLNTHSGSSPVRPNPSLKRSDNGRPPGPGRWYAVHFHRPGPGVLPSSPA